MANIVKVEWFGRQISILLVTGKTVTGELSEITDDYLVLMRGGAESLIMAHAIVAVRLIGESEGKQ